MCTLHLYWEFPAYQRNVTLRRVSRTRKRPSEDRTSGPQPKEGQSENFLAPTAGLQAESGLKCSGELEDSVSSIRRLFVRLLAMSAILM